MRINKEQDFINTLDKLLKADNKLVEKVCVFLHKKLGEDKAQHLKTLSDDSKVNACVGHIAIALTSGDVSLKEIKKVVEQ